MNLSARIIAPKETEFTLRNKKTENTTIGMATVNAHDLLALEPAR